MMPTGIDEAWIKLLCGEQGRKIEQESKLTRSIRTARLLQLMKNPARQLGRHLSRQLGCRVDISSPHITACIDSSSVFRRNGFLVVQLRVYDGRSVLMLEPKAAKTLAESLLVPDGSAYRPMPTEDELTVLSYLFAEALADPSVFGGHRAYLTGIQVYSPAADRRDRSAVYLEQLSREMHLGRAAVVQFRLRIDECSFAAVLIACPNLVRRLIHYSRFQRPEQEMSSLLQRAAVKAAARISIPQQRVAWLSECRAGDRIELARLDDRCAAVISGRGENHCLFQIQLSGRLTAFSENGRLSIGLQSASAAAMEAP